MYGVAFLLSIYSLFLLPNSTPIWSLSPIEPMFPGWANSTTRTLDRPNWTTGNLVFLLASDWFRNGHIIHWGPMIFSMTDLGRRGILGQSFIFPGELSDEFFLLFLSHTVMHKCDQMWCPVIGRSQHSEGDREKRITEKWSQSNCMKGPCGPPYCDISPFVSQYISSLHCIKLVELDFFFNLMPM